MVALRTFPFARCRALVAMATFGVVALIAPTSVAAQDPPGTADGPGVVEETFGSADSKQADTPADTSLVDPSQSGASQADVPQGDTPQSDAPPATDAPESPGIDVLQADADQVRKALESTHAERSAAEKRLLASRVAVTEANRKVESATRAEAAASRRVDQLDDEVAAAAIAIFVGDRAEAPLGILSTQNSQDGAWQSTILAYEADKVTQLLNRQEAAHLELATSRKDASKAAEVVAAAEIAAGHEVDALVAIESDQATFVSQVDQRLDDALAEAAALAELDAIAARDLAKREQALQAAVALSIPSQPELDSQILLAATPVGPSTGNQTPGAPASTPSGSEGPTSSNPSTTTKTPAPVSPPSTTPPTTPAAPALPSVDVVTVGGFVVARSISSQLSAMLTAAQANGVYLGGSGYRDSQRQVELRMKNCGTSFYAIYQMSASLCSPPTAIPGRSMHEKGLAVDLTCSGVLITSRSNLCFFWLAANASTYGLYNLPSEPWHWSTNGN